LPVYCVRGEILDDKYSQSLARNIIDEVVVDKSNGLMWQDDSSVLTTQGNWAFAINHCEALDKAGYNDWRLPNINELMYVLPNNTFSNQFEFPPEPWTRTHPEARPFWSSTPNVLNISDAWAIESEGYNSANYPQTDNNYVRCVRNDLSLARSPYLFDAAGRHSETIDLDTGTTLLTYSYDANTGKLNSITDLFGNQISLIRENGVLTAIESPDGLLTRLVIYNNDLIEVNYEDGSGYQFDYQSSLMTLEVDPNTNQYPHNYDALGRVDYITDPENGVWTFHNTRDSFQRAKVYGYTTAEGRLYESQRVVENGLITKITRNEDGTTVLETENTDTLITTTESGGVTTVRTEEADQKTQKPQFSKQVTTLPGGLSSTLDTVKTYGSNGTDFSKLTTSITFNNKTNTIVEDFKLGTKVLNSAENRQLTINYDPLILLTSSVQNADLFATTYQYDNRGRITLTTTGARSSSNSYESIGRGKLTASTDALNRTTSYEYDLPGRLSAKILYRYDANGNLTGIIPPGKPEHFIEYNSVDNKLQYTPPGLAEINTAYTQYRYNRDRELTQIIRPDLQVIDFIYNNLAQVTIVDTPEGATLYSYNDTTGNVELITAPDGNTLNYLYDGMLNTQTTWTGEINANVTNTYNSVSNIYNNDFVITRREINGTHAINFARDNDLLLTQAGALSINRNATNGLIITTTVK
jgi:YD repeat-containing protein